MSRATNCRSSRSPETSARPGRRPVRSRAVAFEAVEARLLLTATAGHAVERVLRHADLIHRAPAFTARLESPPDPSGQTVVAGRTRPGTFVRVEVGSSVNVVARTRAHANGRFRVAFPVGYGESAVDVIGTGWRRHLRVVRLLVDRPDTAPPTIRILSPASGSTSTSGVTIDGQVADSQSGTGILTASIDGGPPVTVPIQSDGSFSFVPFHPPLSRSNGNHTIEFVVTNRSGGFSASASISLTLDAPPIYDGPTLSIVSQPSQPVLTLGDPGTVGNANGFEGGTVVKVGTTYYLFTSEMIGNPLGVPMRLAIWTSPDGTNWTRATTLEQSSGTLDGTDPRAALWSPIPIFDASANVWNLFYVAYRSLPNTSTEYLNNFDGEIIRAVSTQPGVGGIEGPYQDVGVVLQPGPASQSWEGLQGTDSFYPYQAGGQWYAFYGSASSLYANLAWNVGLVSAPLLAGPWTRQPVGNPVVLDPRIGVENPIVTHLSSGGYLAVFDVVTATNEIGYTYSIDGIHWSPAQYLTLDTSGVWPKVIRTPLALIPNADGTYSLFYTAYYNITGYGRYFAVGKLDVRLNPPVAA